MAEPYNPLEHAAGLRRELRNLGYTVDVTPHGPGVRVTCTRPGPDRPYITAFGLTAVEAYQRAAVLAADRE